MKYASTSSALLLASVITIASAAPSRRQMINADGKVKRAESSSASDTATASDSEYAVSPLSTATITASDGSISTSLVWWEASETTTTGSASTTVAKTSTSVKNNSASTSSESASSISVTTNEFADSPLSTALITESDGSVVTSYVWWEASDSTSATSTNEATSSATATSSASDSADASSSRNWDEALFTTTYTLSDGELTTQAVWWTADSSSSGSVSTTDASTTDASVSTIATTFTSNGETFTTQTLSTYIKDSSKNKTASISSYTVVNGTTSLLSNGAHEIYREAGMKFAVGAAVIGLLL
ncbi:hypothetical protein QEN19_001575 [Hanseniaspora menglaensis]